MNSELVLFPSSSDSTLLLIDIIRLRMSRYSSLDQTEEVPILDVTISKGVKFDIPTFVSEMREKVLPSYHHVPISLKFEGRPGVKDLGLLRDVPSLVSLTLLECVTPYENLDEIGELTSLSELTMGYEDYCVPNLSRLTSLRELKCWFRSSSTELWGNVESLKGLTSLEVLRLQRCEDTIDLSFLTSLPQLRVLDLECCQCEFKMEHIEGLTQLEWLDISGVSGEVPLRGDVLLTLTNLKYLNIQYREFEDLSFIEVLEGRGVEVVKGDNVPKKY